MQYVCLVIDFWLPLVSFLSFYKSNTINKQKGVIKALTYDYGNSVYMAIHAHLCFLLIGAVFVSLTLSSFPFSVLVYRGCSYSQTYCIHVPHCHKFCKLHCMSSYWGTGVCVQSLDKQYFQGGINLSYNCKFGNCQHVGKCLSMLKLLYLLIIAFTKYNIISSPTHQDIRQSCINENLKKKELSKFTKTIDCYFSSLVSDSLAQWKNVFNKLAILLSSPPPSPSINNLLRKISSKKIQFNIYYYMTYQHNKFMV